MHMQICITGIVLFVNIFVDIDECAAQPEPCSPLGICTDTDGSFTCTCRDGYHGDGFTCNGMYLVLTWSKSTSNMLKQLRLYIVIFVSKGTP